MTESTQSVSSPDGFRESSAAGVPETVTPPSVRELLTELAALEDATRDPNAATRLREETAEWLAALAREQEIIDELHRRSPEVPPPDLQTVP